MSERKYLQEDLNYSCCCLTPLSLEKDHRIHSKIHSDDFVTRLNLELVGENSNLDNLITCLR